MKRLTRALADIKSYRSEQASWWVVGCLNTATTALHQVVAWQEAVHGGDAGDRASALIAQVNNEIREEEKLAVIEALKQEQKRITKQKRAHK